MANKYNASKAREIANEFAAEEMVSAVAYVMMNYGVTHWMYIKLPKE